MLLVGLRSFDRAEEGTKQVSLLGGSSALHEVDAITSGLLHVLLRLLLEVLLLHKTACKSAAHDSLWLQKQGHEMAAKWGPDTFSSAMWALFASW